MFFQDREIKRYKRYREVGRELNGTLSGYVGKAGLRKAGKELGMLEGKTLVFGGESEMAVLQDYSIHTHRVGKKSVFDMYMEKTAPSPGSEVYDLLMAHQNAFFSVFHINGTEKGFYCHTTDVLREKDFTIIDSGLGQTASSGSLLAVRLIPIPGCEFFMTTGSGIPFLHKAAIIELQHILSKLLASMPTGKPSPSQERIFAKQVIRMLLRLGTLDQVEYADISAPLP